MRDQGKDILENEENPLEDLEQRALGRSAFAAKIQDRIALTRKRATIAARRLLKARPAFLPKPRTPGELVAVIEYMAKTPRRWGVYLTKPELRAIEEYHALWRQANPEKQPDPTPADAPAHVEPEVLRLDAPAPDRLGDGSGA